MARTKPKISRQDRRKRRKLTERSLSRNSFWREEEKRILEEYPGIEIEELKKQYFENPEKYVRLHHG